MLNSVEGNSAASEITGLRHRVHLPAEEAERRTVLLVHGRAGNAQLMWPFSTAFSRFDPFTVAPEGFVPDPLGGYSWWRVERELPASREELLESVNRLENFIESLPAAYNSPLGTISALGFSQGAALISMLTFKRPDLFSGVGLLAGFIPRMLMNEELFTLPPPGTKLPRFFLGHGTADAVISLDRAMLGREFLESRGLDVTMVTDEVGHKVGAEATRSLKQWFTEIFAPTER